MSAKEVARKPYGAYVHIPFCKSKCSYCTFVSTADLSLEQRYIAALVSEIEGSSLRGTFVDTIYIGGGTPSCLYRGALTAIFCALKNTFDISNDVEITVECNPESVSDCFIDECSENGVNRISMGLQSSDNEVLRTIGRAHDFEKFISAISLLKTRFENISSDIILGLPKQERFDVLRSIDVLKDFCTHISVYALSVEDGTPLFRSGYAADDDYIAELYDCAVERLNGYGFSRYEVSNFAKHGKRSRHNCKYWQCDPYIGFGVASHGYDGDSVRYFHSDSISDYIKDTKPTFNELTPKDMYNEYVMLRLRTSDGIDLRKFTQRFGYSFKTKNADVLKSLERDGLIETDDNFVRIAPQCMFVMNGIIEQLMLD
ncbi:MAG: radical SAM family heme chaperone HemW [Clostridiales bacterium]|nr:radical SAM family heme chaperone HemW [Clostridiales bacterium]